MKLKSFFIAIIIVTNYISTKTFHKNFIFGASTAAIQVEGNCPNSNWHRWIDECNQSKDIAAHKVFPENGCNFCHTYKQDLQQAKEIGLNAFRFSVEWSKIQPTPHTFDEKELDRYEDICKTCNKLGIIPFITLHHYTEPLWFWDMGSFEKEENCHYFVDFCIKIFERLHKYNPMWLTFNTASGIMGKCYINGERPIKKGEVAHYKDNSDYLKKRDFNLAGTVLKNILETHVTIYKKLKSLPGGENAQIGFLKNIQQHKPYCTWNPFDILGAFIANHMADNSIITFLRTGKLLWYAPGICINYYNEDAPDSFDFIGLNYYTYDHIKNFKPIQKSNAILCADKTKAICPDGMYDALMQIHTDLIVPLKEKRHIPIYVTENGIATDNPAHRELFFKGYLKAIKKAMQHGVDVRGYLYWALMDNWSWGTYDRCYGLFHVDRNSPHLTRTLKTDGGTQYLITLIKKSKQR